MAAETVHENPWFSVTRAVDEERRTWFRVCRPDSVIVAARLPGGLAFVHGFRDTTGPDACYELPSGAVEPGEDPEKAAARELREETGLECGPLTCVATYVEAPGISAARTHLMVGDALADGEQHLEPGEDWELRVLSRHEIDEQVLGGRIVDGATLAALALLGARDRAEARPAQE